MLLTRFSSLTRRYTHQSLPVFTTSSPLSLTLFSTLDSPFKCPNDPENHSQQKHPHIDEAHILNQLSDILPIRHSPVIRKPNSSSDKGIETRAVDGFLPPEDKFRGIFLQKILGKNAIETALTNVGIEITPDILDKVVNRGNLGGEAMVMFFNWAVEQPRMTRDVDSFHVLIKALGRRKCFEFMVDMLFDMRKRGTNPNCDTLFIVMDSFIRARRVSKAVKMLDDLEDFGLKCDTETFNVLLKCLIRRSHVGTASSLVNKMRGKIRFNSVTYNSVISGWSRFGIVSEVERTLEAMVEDGLNPDSLTYSYILEGLGRAGQIDGAVKIFRELEEGGCVLNAEVYNAMISNFVVTDNLDEGFKYYEMMLRGDYEPNLDTYVRLISACLKARRVADAIELFDEMLGRGIIPSMGTVTSFIEPLCGYGPPHAALMIYKKARKVGCRISLSCYKLLLMRLSKFGKCNTLMSIWNDMQESGYSSDMQAYECIINAFCNIGQLENAVAVIEESLHRGFCPSRLICSKLNNKLLGLNKTEVAYKLFLKIKVARGNEKARICWRAKGWHF
ncbi:uncharacterized protein [Coffea arabica]|uniref:Uncharacterized protein n=1 Tax=Coffea arabica TaxID=13443 RepID=A0A6P6VUB0_COFAR|nr:putative pentatricopeptide repeat-containing protein At5g43820 [Coffea arabica]XP_027106658.1 putative pentatricopeptide repeat-containing protein At5g43820 [Coffea arabica]